MRRIYILVMLLISAHCMQSTAQHQFYNRRMVSEELFAREGDADLYWKALLLAAANKHDEARALVAAIKTGTVDTIPADPKSGSVDAFFDMLLLAFISRDPQMLTTMGLFEQIGVRSHNAYLNDVRPQSFLQNLEALKIARTELNKFSLADCSPEQKMSYKVFSWTLNHLIEGEQFLFHEYRVNQMLGILIDLSQLFTLLHPLTCEEDADTYIQRLERVPVQLDQTIELLEYQKKIGIVLPAFGIEKVLRNIVKFTESDARENAWYVHFAQNIDQCGVDHKEKYLQRVYDVMTHRVYPAYTKLQTYYEKLLEEYAGINNGVWALPDGDAYYAYMLRRHTTTNLSADEIHEIGLHEVIRIQQEMRRIFVSLGMNDAEKMVGELMTSLAQEDRFYFPQTEQGKQQCMAEFNAIIERSRVTLKKLFDIIPSTPVTLYAVPKHEEDGIAVPYYLKPNVDGSRPGAFYVNLRDMRAIPMYGMESVTIHESEPGHHFQLALQQEMDIPILRKLREDTAYVEGWALYTERLAYEQDFYSTPYHQLGHLQWDLMRAVRLVVDTGIHYKRWTKQRAIEYMVKTVGMNPKLLESEVERYFVMPGQACSYKIGQLKILELRERTKKMRGDTFDIRDFHNVVLKVAAAPLMVLEEAVDEYIKSGVLNR